MDTSDEQLVHIGHCQRFINGGRFGCFCSIAKGLACGWWVIDLAPDV